MYKNSSNDTIGLESDLERVKTLGPLTNVPETEAKSDTKGHYVQSFDSPYMFNAVRIEHGHGGENNNSAKTSSWNVDKNRSQK